MTRYFYTMGRERVEMAGGTLGWLNAMAARVSKKRKRRVIVYEQSGRNPPEILCVWSANP